MKHHKNAWPWPSKDQGRYIGRTAPLGRAILMAQLHFGVALT